MSMQSRTGSSLARRGLARRTRSLGHLLAVVAAGVITSGVVGGALGQETGEGIRWDASRPLRWSDFQGAVDPNAGPRAAALTAASLSLGAELEVRRGRRCEYEITSIETSAQFHPQHSWVLERARTDAVLQHEQGHFDLTDVFRAVLEREAGRLVGAARTCRSDDDMTAIEAEVGELVAELRERIFAELDEVQRRYDAQTGHGTLPDMQSAWSERIRRALSRGAW